MNQLGVIKELNSKYCFKSPKRRINPYHSKNERILKTKNSLSRNKKQISPLKRQTIGSKYGYKILSSQKSDSEVQQKDRDLIISNKLSENAKTTPGNNSCTLESQIEQGLMISNQMKKTANLSLSKNGTKSSKKLFDKKQRKFSDNTNEIITAFAWMKAQHITEQKLLGLVLNEKELHRLQKIYSVQQAEYLTRILNANRL